MNVAASAAPPHRGHWTIDRGYPRLTALLLILAFTLPLLPAGLVYSQRLRDALAENPASGIGVPFNVQWIPLLLLSAWIVFRRRRLFMALLRDCNFMMLVLFAWIVASAFWAPHTLVTLRQSASIVGISLLAYAFTLASWTPWRFSRLLRSLGMVLLVASLVAGAIFPAIGVQPEDQFELAGSWRGITYQKNGLGQLAAITAILWLHAWLGGDARPRFAATGIALALLLLVLSRSSTSLSLTLLSIAMLLLLLRPPVRLREHRGASRLLLTLVILVPLLLYLFFIGTLDVDEIAKQFTSIFGKDATFSGRTPIWAEVIRQIHKHPWMGIGYNSFWVAGPDSPALESVKRLGWSPPSGHNGYVDMINEIGLIGFMIFLGFLTMHFRAIARLARFDRTAAALHLMLIVYIVFANMTEPGWFHPGLFTHVVAMLSSAEVSRRLLERRLRCPAAVPMRGFRGARNPAPPLVNALS